MTRNETQRELLQALNGADLDLSGLSGMEIINDRTDLPDPVGGQHQLEDNTPYLISGFVTISDEIALGDPSPIVGRHGGVSGLVYTGGSDMLNGTDAPYFARDVTFSAPGGTYFDLSGDQTTEMLVESCSFADPAGLGNATGLGTIDGFRVPSFKGCNFEDFDAGLTFDGSADKVFIEGSPIREVDAAGVDVFTLASTSDIQLVDFADNYVKNVQSDTTIWQVEAGGEPSEVLQYRGTLHDTSFGGSAQAVAGALDTESVGVRVSDSYPITDWAVNGDLDIDGAATVPSAGTVTEVVDGNFSGSQTFTLSEQIRTSKEANEGGRLQYDAKDNAITRVFLILSISAANTTVSVFIGKNGNDLERSQSQVETAGAGSPVTVPSTTNIRLNTGDYVSAYVRDDDASNDIEIETMALTLGPA